MSSDRPRCVLLVRGSQIVCDSTGNPLLSPDVAARLAAPEASLIRAAPDDSDAKSLHTTWMLPDATLPDSLEARSLRSLFGNLPEDEFWLVGRAYQLAHWDRTHRFCGVCGAGTELCGREVARCCPSCGQTIYPRISPAVIVAVVREGRLLLAHNAQRKHPFYSVLAGFVEPGESLEECVIREVAEETSIICGNVRYFTSQPWPFPDSLMVAFTAEWVSGEIQVDNEEIDHAYWCSPDALPNVPPAPSVARKLIDWFTANFGS
ncbi:MAG: NAD(+) diphosphatase [Spirochaetales bacterium]